MSTSRGNTGFDRRYPLVFDRFQQLLHRDPSRRHLTRILALALPLAGALLIPFREPLQLQGSISTTVTEAVTAPFPATIDRLLVAPNSRVRDGQPILQLKSSDYREQHIKTVAELRSLKRRIQQAIDTLSNQSLAGEAGHLNDVRALIASLPDSGASSLIRETGLAGDAQRQAAVDLLHEKQATLKRLQGKLADFRRELTIQQRQLSYYEQASRDGAVSLAFVDGQRREVAKSIKDLNDTQASIDEALALSQQARNQLVQLDAQRQVQALEQLDTLVPQFRYLLERYQRFKSRDLITVQAPTDGSVAGLEQLRLGASVSSGQSLFTVVDPTRGFSVQASTDARTRAKLAPGTPAVIRFTNPADGHVERVPSTVSSVGTLSLETNRRSELAGVPPGASYSITFSPDPARESLSALTRERLYAGEVVWVTAYGPTTNLLLTFIRPLRIVIHQWFGS